MERKITEYGCIGEHLGHSFSAEIHAMLGKYDYRLCELKPEEVGDFMRARDFRGINVTIPYKRTVIPYLDSIDGSARAIGAVNTVLCRDGKLIGYNTDFYGMRLLLAAPGSTCAGSARRCWAPGARPRPPARSSSRWFPRAGSLFHRPAPRSSDKEAKCRRTAKSVSS